MFYRKFKPSHSLSSFVECYYVWENDCIPERPLVFESPPSGFTSIVFNYRDSYYLHNYKYQRKIVPNQFIAGHSIYSYSLMLPGKIGMAGIVFKPAALGTLFSIPMYELVEERMDLHLIFKNHIINYYKEEIFNCNDPFSKVQILESFLNEQINLKNPVPDFIDQAANAIEESKGKIKISELMNDIFMSRRSFERSFFHKVGLSPKFYARTRRISFICHQISGKTTVDWNKIWREAGYFDQAHFIKDFELFIGRTPQQYLKDNKELIHMIDRPVMD